MAGVLDLWDTTEHPGLHKSEINNLCLFQVCNYWLIAHQVMNLSFVDNMGGQTVGIFYFPYFISL